MIEICDPNILACPDAEDLLGQLAESKAMVNINQGLDARLLTVSKIELIRRIKMKYYHFAWDNPADESKIVPKLKMFAEMMNANYHNTIVYCLTNYNSTLEEDLHRIYTLRDMNMQPYMMIYDKTHCDKKYISLQRWVNNPWIFHRVKRFEDYDRSKG